MEKRKQNTLADPAKVHGLQRIGDVIRELYPHLKNRE